MKKIILLSILIVSALCVKAQCNLPYKSISDFKNDTSAFIMYNFMDRTDCYLGKTFADIVADIQIPIQTFAYSRFGLELMGIDLFVFSTVFDDNKNKDFNSVNIAWEEPVKKGKEYPIMQGKGGWNQQMYEHYKNMKIKGIYVDINNKKSKYYEKYKTRIDEYRKDDMANRFVFYNGELVMTW